MGEYWGLRIERECLGQVLLHRVNRQILPQQLINRMLFMWLQGKSRKVRHQRSAHCLDAPFQGVCPGHWHSCDKTESFEWESPWRNCDRPTRVKRGDGWTCGVCLIILHLITILSQALVIYLYMRTIRWFICVPSMWHFCISFLWFITIS